MIFKCLKKKKKPSPKSTQPDFKGAANLPHKPKVVKGPWSHDHVHKNLKHTAPDVLEHGFLPRTGELYAVRFLGPEFLDMIMDLQERVYKDLKPEEKTFIVHKTREFFENHLKGGHPIIGVISGDKVIAQSVIRIPNAHDPKTGMADMPHLSDMPIDSVTVLQGVLCDPEHRGNKLMQSMVKHWLAWAGQNGRSNAVAEIEIRNHHSWSVFLEAGLWLVSIGYDKSDGSTVYNVHQELPEDGKIKYKALRKLGDEFEKAANGESVTVVQANDLKKQKALMELGYTCRGWDKATKTMAFVKPQV